MRCNRCGGWKYQENPYRIVRFFADDSVSKQIIETGLMLEEAQEHCKGPETSSASCTSQICLARTQEWGPWFDGYEEY